jgi:hypothetical protein
MAIRAFAIAPALQDLQRAISRPNGSIAALDRNVAFAQEPIDLRTLRSSTHPRAGLWCR